MAWLTPGIEGAHRQFSYLLILNLAILTTEGKYLKATACADLVRPMMTEPALSMGACTDFLVQEHRLRMLALHSHCIGYCKDCRGDLRVCGGGIQK